MKISARVFVRGFVLIVLLVAGGWLIKTFASELADEAWVDAHIRGSGLVGDLTFIAIASLLAACGFPRQVISFTAGYAFGLGMGFTHGMIAAGIGCVLAFLAARYVARDLVAHRLPSRFKRIDEFLSGNTFSATLAIRFLPLGNNLAVNLAAGLSRASGPTFVIASVLGYVPQTFVFALLGSGLNVDPELRLSLGVVLFVVATALGIALFRKYRRAREVEQILESPKEG
jgi:uncharacterized membrane protein YdjX (TVP38/TMEM64 family)